MASRNAATTTAMYRKDRTRQPFAGPDVEEPPEPRDHGRSLLQLRCIGSPCANLQRLLSPVVELREERRRRRFLMFAYSFCAMTAYNIIKPITRSKFITDLGADNLPYVLLVAGFIIGVLMAGYTWLMPAAAAPVGPADRQVGMAALLVVFWFLFQTQATVGRRSRSTCAGCCSASCSSASSGRSPTSSTTRARRSGCSASSAAARRSAASPARLLADARHADRHRSTCCCYSAGILLLCAALVVVDHRAREQPADAGRGQRRRRREGRQRRRGVPAAAASRSTCRSSRS